MPPIHNVFQAHVCQPLWNVLSLETHPAVVMFQPQELKMMFVQVFPGPAGVLPGYC
jgi:hypothetical protein